MLYKNWQLKDGSSDFCDDTCEKKNTNEACKDHDRECGSRCNIATNERGPV